MTGNRPIGAAPGDGQPRSISPTAAPRLSREEAFSEVLRLAVDAVERLDDIAEDLALAADQALPLVDQFKVSIAGEALSLMEHWPS